MELGKVELLSSEEIEKRMYETEAAIKGILSTLGPPLSKDMENIRKLDKLREDLEAYNTAIDYAA